MVKIIADSTCDLSAGLLEKYEVSVLPLHILLGEQEYEDGVDLTPEEIYRWSDEHKTTPKTSAPPLTEQWNCFVPTIENGCEIVCFAISEEMSTSANVMRLAAEELDASDRVTVIDSASLSTGIGLLVIEAAVMAKEGEKAAQIAARMEELKPLVRASFVVDTLTYLHRGGRCSGVAALAGERAETASEDCGGKWKNESGEKVPRKNGESSSGLYKRFKGSALPGPERQGFYHTFRV